MLCCCLEDEEDAKVGNMVSLIVDDYPFEHNTWTGGVKAAEVKQKNIPTQHHASIEGNQPGEHLCKDDIHSGFDSGVDRPERFPIPPSPVTAPHVDSTRGLDSSGVLRLERYMQEIKDHFNVVVDAIRTELATAVKAISALEKIVKFALAKGVDFSAGKGNNMDAMDNMLSPRGGSSPCAGNSSNPCADGGGQLPTTEEAGAPDIALYGGVVEEHSTGDDTEKIDIFEEDSQVNAPVRRCSKRTRQNPNRYTPVETKKKESTKRKTAIASDVNVVPPAKVKKVTPSVGPTTSPAAEDITFVGGFKPFVQPTSSKQSAFLKLMEETKRNKIPSSRFDFIPSFFFTNLICNFPSFDGLENKQEFTFSANLRDQFIYWPKWFVDVDFVYSPVLINTQQWVGMIVDFQHWAIYVVDSNMASPTDFRVNDVITQIPILLPHLIHRYSHSNLALELDFVPLPISRLDIPFLLEHPGTCCLGFTALVALLLLEFHAVGKPVSSGTLTADTVRIAAENYAIEMLELALSVSTDQEP
ncbi:hypothetical protein N665_0131s0008 [Sinapis alba]|nr:hypothetical protein N665_0131s0008 [Sinapis alba]